LWTTQICSCRNYLAVLVVNARARYDDASVSGRDYPADHPRVDVDGRLHIRALLAAYVIANGSPSSVTRVPAKEMGDVVTELERAANFHRSFAELCETAERRLLDVAMSAA
jgi:hypothetical protein